MALRYDIRHGYVQRKPIWLATGKIDPILKVSIFCLVSCRVQIWCIWALSSIGDEFTPSKWRQSCWWHLLGQWQVNMLHLSFFFFLTPGHAQTMSVFTSWDKATRFRRTAMSSYWSCNNDMAFIVWCFQYYWTCPLTQIPFFPDCPIQEWTGKKYYHQIRLCKCKGECSVYSAYKVTWNVLSWSGGHEFKPWLGQTLGAWYFCPKSYLNQNIRITLHNWTFTFTYIV